LPKSSFFWFWIFAAYSLLKGTILNLLIDFYFIM
jgi:hypothetical protein